MSFNRNGYQVWEKEIVQSGADYRCQIKPSIINIVGYFVDNGRAYLFVKFDAAHFEDFKKFIKWNEFSTPPSHTKYLNEYSFQIPNAEYLQSFLQKLRLLNADIDLITGDILNAFKRENINNPTIDGWLKATSSANACKFISRLPDSKLKSLYIQFRDDEIHLNIRAKGKFREEFTSALSKLGYDYHSWDKADSYVLRTKFQLKTALEVLASIEPSVAHAAKDLFATPYNKEATYLNKYSLYSHNNTAQQQQFNIAGESMAPTTP